MKEIQIHGTNKKARVDDEDFEELNKYNWFASFSSYKTTIYAHRCVSKGGVKKTIIMHRVILNVTEKEIQVDHIDHDGLNNQRSNLRIANRVQNGANRRPYGKSKYLGVHIAKSTAKFKNGRVVSYEYWRARIKHNNKYLSLGCFKNEIEAAKAYDLAAVKLHGEFANLNFKRQGFNSKTLNKEV